MNPSSSLATQPTGTGQGGPGATLPTGQAPTTGPIRPGQTGPPQTGLPPVTPASATTTTISYTPFLCIARIVETPDRVPNGKKAVLLRVAVTDGKVERGWFRLQHDVNQVTAQVEFNSAGMGESDTLVVAAGATVTAQVFASSQFIPASMACNVRSTVRP